LCLRVIGPFSLMILIERETSLKRFLGEGPIFP
jgi:hypothetical protein